jgi:hypothetical protein
LDFLIVIIILWIHFGSWSSLTTSFYPVAGKIPQKVSGFQARHRCRTQPGNKSSSHGAGKIFLGLTEKVDGINAGMRGYSDGFSRYAQSLEKFRGVSGASGYYKYKHPVTR